jgi:hypothetical protein
MKASFLGAFLLVGFTAGCSCDPDPDPAPPRAAHDCQEPPACAAGERVELGFCVPKCRERGAEGCACHVDGSCSLLDDEPLSCVANVCVKGKPRAPGQLGGSCTAAEPCSGELRCVAGECQVSHCSTGQRGCACGPYGTCDAYAGRPMRCSADNTCAIAECVAKPNGKLPAGARCRNAASCETGLSCRAGTCLLAEATLSVSGASARACDVVLEAANGGKFEGFSFAKQVRGEAFSRSSQAALSFFTSSEGALKGTAARLEYRAGLPPALLQQTCYDADGKALAGTQVSLQ